ncbi:MAG: hypothetical protein AAGL96_18925 [Pseudomonadota bacterium]
MSQVPFRVLLGNIEELPGDTFSEDTGYALLRKGERVIATIRRRKDGQLSAFPVDPDKHRHQVLAVHECEKRTPRHAA